MNEEKFSRLKALATRGLQETDALQATGTDVTDIVEWFRWILFVTRDGSLPDDYVEQGRLHRDALRFLERQQPGGDVQGLRHTINEVLLLLDD